MKSHRRSNSPRKAILVADCDPAVLLLAQAMLVAEGYRVLLATAAHHAHRLAKMKHLRIDLALVEQEMAERNGGELKRQLASARPDLPIMFMSGFVDDKVVRLKMPSLPALDTADSPFCMGAVQ